MIIGFGAAQTDPSNNCSVVNLKHAAGLTHTPYYKQCTPDHKPCALYTTVCTESAAFAMALPDLMSERTVGYGQTRVRVPPLLRIVVAAVGTLRQR
jgi:hypothetical protein